MSKEQELVFKNVFVALAYMLVAMCLLTFVIGGMATTVALIVVCFALVSLYVVYLVKKMHGEQKEHQQRYV